MITNIRIAIRSLLKNKVYTLISSVGLSIALACATLIFLFLNQEFNYNSFHKNKDAIYRVGYTMKYAHRESQQSLYFYDEIATQLKSKLPQIKTSVNYRVSEKIRLIVNNEAHYQRIGFTEPGFLEMFDFGLITGDGNQLLSEPNQIVITKTLSEKLFGNSIHDSISVIGKTIYFPFATGEKNYTVIAVLDEIPRNSTFDFDALVPKKSILGGGFNNNLVGNSLLFIQSKEAINQNQLEELVNKAVNEILSSFIELFKGYGVLADEPDCFTSYLTPLTQTYLDSDNWSSYQRHSNRRSFMILLWIGVLIFVIALSNIVLLETGLSLKQHGEVGTRKALGASAKDIFYQFFTKGFILILISLFLASVLAYSIQPLFGRYFDAEIYTELIKPWQLQLFILILFFIVSVISGLVSLVSFAKVNPNEFAIKKYTSKAGNGSSPWFVTVQYSLSIVLIIATVFAYRQTQFLKNMPLGFKHQNIIKADVDWLNNNTRILLRDLMANAPGVEYASLSDRDLIYGRSTRGISGGIVDNLEARILKVDKNYIPTLGLELISGTNFTELNQKANDNTVIINNYLLKLLEFKGPAEGKQIWIGGDPFIIKGVIKDFHFDSMKEKLEPLILYSRTNFGNNYRALFIKSQPNKTAEVISLLKKNWDELAPNEDLNFSLLSSLLKDRYQDEERLGSIISSASIIAVLISSMGLLGLSLLIINQRIKEIGVRKVNGANTIEISTMFGIIIFRWIIMAFILATPIGYLVVKKWLSSFPYQTPVSWWMFLLVGLLTLLLALITIGVQTYRAARRNPVEALRYE